MKKILLLLVIVLFLSLCSNKPEPDIPENFYLKLVYESENIIIYHEFGLIETTNNKIEERKKLILLQTSLSVLKTNKTKRKKSSILLQNK